MKQTVVHISTLLHNKKKEKGLKKELKKELKKLLLKLHIILRQHESLSNWYGAEGNIRRKSPLSRRNWISGDKKKIKNHTIYQ